MALIKKYLSWILVVAVCTVAYVVYESYFAAAPSDVLTSSAATSTPGGPDLLSTLSNLKAVTLDPSLFSDPVFVSLVDFGVTIPPEPVGRSNPFAPLSGQVSQSGSAGISPAIIKPNR